MGKPARLLAVLGLVAATFCAGHASKGGTDAAQAQSKTPPLFLIERSKNANVVHYDAQLGPDGKLNPKEPVIAYWILLAKDGSREDLNWIEKKKAYGFEIKPGPSGAEFKMTVVSAPDRPITVKMAGNIPRAELAIDGHPAVLEKMYINATDGLTGPTVNYIELHGKDMKTGEKRSEKIMAK
jgi:hypothetical protein